MNENCYSILNQVISFCTFIPNHDSNAKVFGFSEFLTSAALLIIVFTTADTRYKFRVATVSVDLQRRAFWCLLIVGTLTLLIDIWIAEKFRVLNLSIPSLKIVLEFPSGIVQGILGSVIFFTFLSWARYAFMQPPIFSKGNCKNYANKFIECISFGDKQELSIIAEEFERSIEPILSSTYTFNEFENRGKVNDSNQKYMAYKILQSLNNTRFTETIMKKSPQIAISFLTELKRQNRYDIPMHHFVYKLSREALSNSESKLFDEFRGLTLDKNQKKLVEGKHLEEYSLSSSLYGNYELVKALASKELSPFDIDYLERSKWTEKNWQIYVNAVQVFFQEYLRKTKGLENSLKLTEALTPAFRIVIRSTVNLSSIDGHKKFLLEDEYLKLKHVVYFAESCLDLKDSHIIDEDLKRKAHKILRENETKSDEKNVYLMIVNLIFSTITNASKLKSPGKATSDIYDLIRKHLLPRYRETFSKSDSTIRRLLYKKIYQEISQIKTKPNEKNMSLLGFCLNILYFQLETESKRGIKSKTEERLKYKGSPKINDLRAFDAFHEVVLRLTENNFLNIHNIDPVLANQAIYGQLSFDLNLKTIIYKPVSSNAKSKPIPKNILKVN